MQQHTDVALPGFNQAAIQRQDVTIPLDTDVLAYIQGEFGDWKDHINDLLRFFMETNQRREIEFQDCFDPGEMDAPPPDLPRPRYLERNPRKFRRLGASRHQPPTPAQKAETALYGLLWPKGETFFWKAILPRSFDLWTIEKVGALVEEMRAVNPALKAYTQT